jgi:hypothetical protein
MVVAGEPTQLLFGDTHVHTLPRLGLFTNFQREIRYEMDYQNIGCYCHFYRLDRL